MVINKNNVFQIKKKLIFLQWLKKENAGDRVGWDEECPAGLVLSGAQQISPWNVLKILTLLLWLTVKLVLVT